MKKTTILLLTVILLLTSLAGCGEQEATSKNVAEPTSENTQYTDETTEPLIDEDVPLCISKLNPIKNSDGTYSFDGYCTKVSDSATCIYIRALNGKTFSSGNSVLLNAMYIDPDDYVPHGVLSELFEGNIKVTKILFRFTFDTDGNMIDVKQIG